MLDNFKAQFGEDKLLAEYFGHKPTGYYVEVGAYDGVRMSNTFHFEQLGWRGLLIEADPALVEQCRAARPGATIVSCAVVAPDAPAMVTFSVSEDWKSLSSLSFNNSRRAQLERLSGGVRISEISVPGRTLDSILAEHAVGAIDFLTIDVEGHEWDVLRGFSIARWRPEIMIIERNTLFPDVRIARYMFEHGYRYMRTTGVNDWFGPAAPNLGDTVLNLSHFGATFYIIRPLRIGAARVRKPLRRIVRGSLARLGLLETAQRLWRSRSSARQST